MLGGPPSKHNHIRTRETKENGDRPYHMSPSCGNVKIMYVEVEFHKCYEYRHDDYMHFIMEAMYYGYGRLDIILGSIWFTIDDFILKKHGFCLSKCLVYYTVFKIESPVCNPRFWLGLVAVGSCQNFEKRENMFWISNFL